DAFGAEQVLVADGRTEQGAGLTSGAACVGGLSLGQRLLFGDGDETVELRVEPGDARHQGAGQFYGGKLMVGEAVSDLGEGQLMHVGILDHSITRGTRYRPSSTAGAMAW